MAFGTRKDGRVYPKTAARCTECGNLFRGSRDVFFSERGALCRGCHEKHEKATLVNRDAALWNLAGQYRGGDVREFDKFLRNHGYRSAVRGGREWYWVSEDGFPYRAEVEGGRIAKIERRLHRGP